MLTQPNGTLLVPDIWRGTNLWSLVAATHVISAQERTQMTVVAAYYRAERRGFAAGHELSDWLAAEREFAMLVSAAPSAG